jgi:hypothetical protein
MSAQTAHPVMLEALELTVTFWDTAWVASREMVSQ